MESRNGNSSVTNYVAYRQLDVMLDNNVGQLNIIQLASGQK